MNQTLIDNYLKQLSEIHDGEHWIDETFKKKIAPLTDAEAFAKPHSNIHSVAELISHLAEWRKVIADALAARSWDIQHIMSPEKATPHVLTPFAHFEKGTLTYPKPIDPSSLF